ncbi:hypothetical protein VNO77_07619 [Canavalia gladiata]|uniref:Uncharacterized protein n=1 Tax=Canavalia gladiata TaxID=3824 RepID=A0AAN9MBL2_CANGL
MPSNSVPEDPEVPEHPEDPEDPEWIVAIDVMLGSLNHAEVQACSISSIPDEIQAPKEDAFKPKEVSIGPLHRRTTRHLQLMEETKWLYMNEFLKRKGSPQQNSGSDVLSVLNDITMLENQIPFIVLKKLYRKVFPQSVRTEIEDDHRIAKLVRKAFGCPLDDSAGGAHILNLMHLSTVQHDNVERKEAKQELKRCATRLKAAGIIIQAETDCQRALVDKFNFKINFSGGVLTIPQLHIKETTEVKWRNLIAWEQSKISVCCKYTSYALFFKGLICCKHDIKLLEEMKVLVNEVNMKNDDLLQLFDTISEGTEHMDSSYSELCGNLNMYRKRKMATVLQRLPIITWHKCVHASEIMLYYWGNWYRLLIRDHIPTVWKFIGVLAAVVLLILTIMQTYYEAPTITIFASSDSHSSPPLLRLGLNNKDIDVLVDPTLGKNYNKNEMFQMIEVEGVLLGVSLIGKLVAVTGIS